MNPGLSAKLLSVLVIASVCALGFTTMNAWATVTPTAGQVAIDQSYLFNLSSTVRVYFMGGSDWYGSSLVLDHEYAQINGGTEIGVDSSVECNLNLTTWSTIPAGSSGTVAAFTLWSSTGWTAFSFYVGNLVSGAWYNVYIDGSLGPEKLTGTPITWAFSGAAGTHTFEVRQSSMSPQNVNLINLIFLFLSLTLVMVPTNLLRKCMKRKKGPNIHEILNVFIILIVGLVLIVAAWAVVG